MQNHIIYEIVEGKKKELDKFLRESGLSNKYVEKLELHFHQNGELSFVKPLLRF